MALDRTQIRRCVERLENLPTLPVVASRIISLTTDERATAEDIARVIESDQAITSRVLTLVNSPSYGFQTTVKTVGNAVALLGVSAIRSVVLGMAVTQLFPGNGTRRGFDRKEFWKHSLACAVCAEILAERKLPRVSKEAFVAGLLHDIGKIVLDACLGVEFQRVLDRARDANCFIIDAERELLGTDHSEVGKWMAERWRLPEMFTEVIWLHHHLPSTFSGTSVHSDMVNLVHLADLIVRRQMIGSSGDKRSYSLSSDLLKQMTFTLKDIDEMSILLCKRMEERSKLFDLELDEKGLYLESLRKANYELSRINLCMDEQNRDLSRKAELFTILHEMNTRILPSHSVRDILGIIAESLKTGVGIERGLCYVADQSRSVVEGKAWGQESSAISDVEFPIGAKQAESSESFRNLDIVLAETLKVTALKADSGVWVGTHMREVFERNNVTVVPMIAEGKSLGQIVIDNRLKGRSLLQREIAELLTIASAAGLAVSRSRLQERLNQRSEELATAIWKKEQAHQQLLRSERLASVGKMAAGAAHEINNPLAIISGRAQVLLEKEKDQAIARSLKVIVEQCLRASKILIDLMGFARPAMPKTEPANINFIIYQVMTMLENRLALKNVKCVQNFAEDLPKVMVDKHQMEQVFFNLFNNAEHAMENGGTLAVGTELSRDGKFAIVKLSDTGTGIARENLEHIFEPFFTTKEEGKGTGLGLSLVYGIITSHKGEISVDSKVGEGTTFTIRLPIAVNIEKVERSAEQTWPVKPAPPVTAEGGAAERILAVDDEEEIRQLLKETLADRGYVADVAENGLKAIECLKRQHYDIMLLDIRMPTMDGLQLLSGIREKLPEMPVLIVTGLASSEEAQKALDLGASAIVRKPFHLNELLDEIHKALAKKKQKS